MFKSSFTTHSSIDHDLFPLLTVRSCVSEADESRNGPRFCAEDKMTGAAYEIRNRKLILESESGGVGNTANSCVDRQLSQNDLCTIRRQQERINALLTASTHCAVPPCVALPIDVYIQEQPSTGDTYVASVDAFSGLSLGDIIRSGWGVMEEGVFLEILNAVEAFGYASASLPPHGNLSSDAIKQLLIVRDGAWEARQPSRWVVSDWLLLSDDNVTTFDPHAFLGDLEWVLHSSFAQLHISTATEQGSTLMPQYRVEQLVSETVDRIRAHLLREVPGTQETSSAEDLIHESEATPQQNANVLAESGDASLHSGAATSTADAKLPTSRNEDASSAALNLADDQVPECVSTTPEALVEFQVPGAASPSAESRHDLCNIAGGDRDASATTVSSTARSSLNTPLTAPLDDKKSFTSHGNTDEREADNEALHTARDMSLKDKMAYHQAALRHEQLLVNKHRRKNAPLPPRPQPVHTQGRNPQPSFSSKASDEYDDDYYYNPPSLTSPIKVRPSAYLMQGSRHVGSGRRGGGAGALNGEAPRKSERSQSSTTSQRSPPSMSTPRLSSSREQLRERLLDDVVSIAVMNQRQRAQNHRLQREAERRQRDERQQALFSRSPSGGATSQQPVMRAITGKSPASNLHHLSPNSLSGRSKYAGTSTRQKRCAPVSSTPRCNSSENVRPRASAAPSSRLSAPAAAPSVTALARSGSVSESPEPRPPSPEVSRNGDPTLCRPAPHRTAGTGTRIAPQARGGRDTTGTVAMRISGKTLVKKMTSLQLPSRGTHSATSATAGQFAAAHTNHGAGARRRGQVVEVVAVGGNNDFSLRQPEANTEPRLATSPGASRKPQAGVDRQRQQRFGKTNAAVHPLISPRHPTVLLSATTPSVVPQQQADAGEQVTSAPGPPVIRTVGCLPVVSERNTGEATPTHVSLKKKRSLLLRLPQDSPRQLIKCSGAVLQRRPNSARPRLLERNPQVPAFGFQRFFSTGALRSPLSSVTVTPRGRQAAGIPTSELRPSLLLRESLPSGRKGKRQSEVLKTSAVHPVQRGPHATVGAEAKKANTADHRGLIERPVVQKPLRRHTASSFPKAETQRTDLPPATAKKRCLISMCAPPPRTGPSGAAPIVSSRRANPTNAPPEKNGFEGNSRTSRRRSVLVSTTSPGAYLAAATQGRINKDRKDVAAMCGKGIDLSTQAQVGSTNGVSPGLVPRSDQLPRT